MDFQLSLSIPPLLPRIQHPHKIYLVGSCFTEHIHHFLQRYKFSVKQNSHGIVFNPLSVCKSLQDVVDQKEYKSDDLFYLNEYWNSWFHHSDFSFLNQELTLQTINQTIYDHHQFLKDADYVFITLGSGFAYYQLEENFYVSNNHRGPAAWFRKDLLTVNQMVDEMNKTMNAIKIINPNIKFVYTISPVRHIRDGLIDNNRSKARLIEAVHQLEGCYYFPAYELVIDVLRDYRFYDVDMVHPNYQATAFVWEQFRMACLEEPSPGLFKSLDQIYKAFHHKPKDTQSKAHADFKGQQLKLCKEIKEQFPYLPLAEEIAYFSN